MVHKVSVLFARPDSCYFDLVGCMAVNPKGPAVARPGFLVADQARQGRDSRPDAPQGVGASQGLAACSALPCAARVSRALKADLPWVQLALPLAEDSAAAITEGVSVSLSAAAGDGFEGRAAPSGPAAAGVAPEARA